MNEAEFVLKRIEKTQPDSYWTEYVPDFFDYKNVLYIGIERYRAVFIKNFLDHGYKIDLLEIWEPHVEHYRKANKVLNMFGEIYHGDVRNVDEIIHKRYDQVLWFHGPEHLEREEIPAVLRKLSKMTLKLIAMACPYGESTSPARGGNEHNRHYSALFPLDFLNWGFSVEASDKRIKAWRYQ